MPICPECSSVMKDLFLSCYCPNDCDKSPITGWHDIPNTTWKCKLLSESQTLPSNATHGWWISVYYTTHPSEFLEYVLSFITIEDSVPGLWKLVFDSKFRVPEGKALAVFKENKI